jgi:hypothetical protein
LIVIVLSSTDNTLDLLLELIEKDIAIQKQFADDATLTTDYNLIRLHKWQIKFQGLLQYRRRLYNS